MRKWSFLSLLACLASMFSCGYVDDIDTGSYQDGMKNALPGGLIQTVRINFIDVNNIAYYCTGTLVAPNIVLTAKHCFTTLPSPSQVQYILAKVNGQDVRVDMVKDTLKKIPNDAFDVALIGLAQPLDLLVQRPYVVFPQQPLIIPSWYWYNGRVNSGTISKTDVFHQQIEIVDIRPNDNLLVSNTSYSQSEKGDSGGPLFRDNDYANDGMGGASAPILYGVNYGFDSDQQETFFTTLVPIVQWLTRYVFDQDLPCSTWDGDIKGCDAHREGFNQDCAYYSCSNACRPRGTSNCEAGCGEYCTGNRDLDGPCSTWNGDSGGCDLHQWKLTETQDCAYIGCSQTCAPRGASYCASGCGEYCARHN